MGAVPGRVAVGLAELVRVAVGLAELVRVGAGLAESLVGRADASGRVRWAEGVGVPDVAGAERVGGWLLGGELGVAVGVIVGTSAVMTGTVGSGTVGALGAGSW